MATWAASGRPPRRRARDGKVVLAAGGQRFLVRRAPDGTLHVLTSDGRLAGVAADLAECEARLRDLVARRGD